MINAQSPLEALAAFAITFVAGIVTTAALGGYIGRLRKAAQANTPVNPGVSGFLCLRRGNDSVTSLSLGPCQAAGGAPG